LSVVTQRALSLGDGEAINPADASVHGLVGSLAKEYAQWRVRLLDTDTLDETGLAALLRLPADAQGDAWLYRAGEFYRSQLLAAQWGPARPTRYRDGGVYVLLGGAGGIGEVYSEYLITRYRAQVVWLGRRAADAAIAAKIARLGQHGPAPLYLQADATDAAALAAACAQIRARYGAIHGLVHSAIVLADQSLAQMDEARFRASLAAKVDASVQLARAFGGEALDFVLFFSSLQSFSKAPGQSNYAAGCTFSDAYAQQLRQAWPCAVKVVNWGYWGSVGIVSSDFYRDRMALLGFGSIEPEEALQALEQLLSGPLDQVAYLKLSRARAPDAADGGTALQVYGPAPQQDLAAVQRELARRIAAPALPPAEADTGLRLLETELARLLFVQMDSLCLWTPATFTLEALKTRLDPQFGRWLAESVRLLELQGYLVREGEGYRVVQRVEADAWLDWEAAKHGWLAQPNLRG
ncbi:SDR family NAD(P)-dependent oxidoreductase, partial [Tahibacter harae]